MLTTLSSCCNSTEGGKAREKDKGEKEEGRTTVSDIQTHIKRCSCTTAANHIAAYYSEQSHLKAPRLHWERDIKRLDKQFLD